MSTSDLTSLLAYDVNGNNNVNDGAITSATWGNYVFKFKRNETINGVLHYIYDLHNGTSFQNSTDVNAIKVIASDIYSFSSWSDYGSDFPTSIVQDGVNMELRVNNYVFFRCAIPTSSGGGGSSSSVSSKKVFSNFW